MQTMPTNAKPTTRVVQLLMCAPSAYDLLYEINAWMHLSDKPDKRQAWKQWEQLYQTLTEQVGIPVALIEQASEAPDMVFTANAGLPLPGRQIVLSRFRHPERQVEEPYFEQWFRQQGYQIHLMPSNCAFEGEGDAFLIEDTIVAGYRKRTDICAHRYLSELTGLPTLSLELVDDRWYHLDTCFLPLGGRLVAYYPDAFDWYARRVIEQHFETIPVTPEEALKFACNSVVIGKHVVMPAGCPVLRFYLEEHGYTVYEVPMSEFIKSGGACAPDQP
ncbi:MAG: arginine deiminase-related protein, partial [Fimbriimonadales bacterium]